MKIEDKDKVYVLDATDKAVWTDSDGDTHSVIQQHRMLLVLSVPKQIELDPSACYDEVPEQLVEAVAKAMEPQ